MDESHHRQNECLYAKPSAAPMEPDNTPKNTGVLAIATMFPS